MTTNDTTQPGYLDLSVAAGEGDYHDGEPAGTVDLHGLGTEMRSIATRLPGIPGLLAAAACDGDCNAAQMLSEIAAEADLTALAFEIADVIRRLSNVWDVIPNGAAPDNTPQDKRHQAMGGQP